MCKKKFKQNKISREKQVQQVKFNIMTFSSISTKSMKTLLLLRTNPVCIPKTYR